MIATKLGVLALLYLLAIGMAAHLLVAWWLLGRAETRLRPGLEPDDVDDFTNEPVDDSYLSESGRTDRRRGWRLLRRGLWCGAAMAAVFVVALLAHIPMAT